MESPIVRRTIGFGLLAALVCGLSQIAIAGGPLVWWGPRERALLAAAPHGLGPDDIDYGAQIDNLVPPTGLIPTNWKSNTELIPSEIHAQTLPIQRDLFYSAPPTARDNENFYLNRQIRILATGNRSPMPAELVTERMTKLSQVDTLRKSVRHSRPWRQYSQSEAIPQTK
jgi:hypothetical protein